MKVLLILCGVLLLSACSTSPQKLNVLPDLSFGNIQGAKVAVELIISDKREDTKILGYRNAKRQGPITFSQPLSKTLGESIQKALQQQGVEMKKGPEPLSKLEVQVLDLFYRSPDETWVSKIEMGATILVSVTRGNSNIKKRFSANRHQDVATAPSAEFNQEFMNAMLSELLNKAMNDREIASFLK